VTGGSRGLGAAIAEALAQAGCRILLNYRANHPAAEAVAARIRASGGAVDLLPFDVADAQASAQALRGLDLYRDPVDIVVNNAGIVRDGPFAGMKQPDWDAVIRTNLDSFYNVTQPLVLPMARKRWGRIISIVSRSGLNGHRGQVNYSAAKAGLVGATKALARELATRNITVNAVCPGLFATDMLAGIDVEALRQRIALGRLGQAAELAEAVRFLASDEASYITGHVLVVDGGLQL
jgi:3-oxoacyl-[acyl-carrier protein] reductase